MKVTTENLWSSFIEKEEKENTLDGSIHEYKNDIKKLMIEFAKLHVKAALEEALESIPCLGSSTDIATYEEVEKAVLNSYPLNKIK